MIEAAGIPTMIELNDEFHLVVFHRSIKTRRMLLCVLKIHGTVTDKMNLGSELLFLFDVGAIYDILVVSGIEMVESFMP